jgi:branched-chain amino acid transport system permease protein
MGARAQHCSAARDPDSLAGRICHVEAGMKRSALITAAVMAGLAPIPFLGGAYITMFIFILLIQFVLAQSWDWVGGEMGYVNLGHFAFYGVGAYAFSIALVTGWQFPAAFMFGVAVTIIIAIAVAYPLFRLRGDYFAFATLALLPLAELLAFNLVPITNGADGIVLPPHYVLQPAFALALVLAGATVVTTLYLKRNWFGFALRCIRNDEQAAETIGIRILPVKMCNMALSAAFAAAAGAVHAWQLSYIDPPTVFGLHVALVPVSMALLGGSGLLWGPLVGVVILSVAQQWLLVNIVMMQATIYGAVILLIGRFMPGGLLRARWIGRSPLLGMLARDNIVSVPRSREGRAPDTLPFPPRDVSARRSLLEIENLTKKFGGNVAVSGVSLTIREGEIVGLIGANGSGKTTLFNCICKVLTPESGRILFADRNVAALRCDEIARLGIGRTYQIPRPFPDQTVRENISSAVMFCGEGALGAEAALVEATSYAAFVGLADKIDTRADSLSLQEKKALELARALATRPKLLLIDEVASGLTTVEVKRFVAHVRQIRDSYGITVIWVEHIFSALAQIVDRVLVLEQGVVIADGPLGDIVRDARVLKTYLGSAASKVA